MGLLSPHRRFIDPGNTDGIPRVSRHRPAPSRESPLPGTKTLLTPKDPDFHELVSKPRIEPAQARRTGRVLGIIALVLAVLLPAHVCVIGFIRKSHPEYEGGLWIVIVVFPLVHLLAIFSQVLSSGRNLAGSLAIPVLYVAFIACVLIDHLLG